MKLEDILYARSNHSCELCAAPGAMAIYEVPPAGDKNEDTCILTCNKCLAQLDKKEETDSTHWQAALPASMWSQLPAVQVTVWRMLNRLRHQSWAADNLDMLYLEEETLAWAKATGDHESDGSVDLHKDANGALLQTGDTVILTRSLDVKGSNLHAKMGTVVKNIRLVAGNTEQVEGKIEGQTIVILTKYVRKQHAAQMG